jgi:GMP synthase-like glutamine amidotransferase
MRIHCIRHEPFEGLACIEDWISRNNHKLSSTYTYMEQSFPTECAFDLLIIMGGTASVYDSLHKSWYREEKQFLENCLRQGKKMLGICLGAQILASILGSKVYPGRTKEIGWYPVDFTKAPKNGMSFLPERINTFHWHGDTFDLPEGAVHLASSAVTPNQGFIYSDHIVALQFHLEMTGASLKKIIRVAGKEILQGGDFVQTSEQIINQQELINSNNSLMFQILDYLST